MPLSIQNLDAYKLAIGLNRSVAGLNFPKHRAHLRDQGIRAADSVVLNIAEGIGRGRQTNAGKNHSRIAKGPTSLSSNKLPTRLSPTSAAA